MGSSIVNNKPCTVAPLKRVILSSNFVSLGEAIFPVKTRGSLFYGDAS